jgi:hypothetical protein
MLGGACPQVPLRQWLIGVNEICLNTFLLRTSSPSTSEHAMNLGQSNGGCCTVETQVRTEAH